MSMLGDNQHMEVIPKEFKKVDMLISKLNGHCMERKFKTVTRKSLQYYLRDVKQKLYPLAGKVLLSLVENIEVILQDAVYAIENFPKRNSTKSFTSAHKNRSKEIIYSLYTWLDNLNATTYLYWLQKISKTGATGVYLDRTMVKALPEQTKTDAEIQKPPLQELDEAREIVYQMDPKTDSVNEELTHATLQLSSSLAVDRNQLLGEGTFGVVYKGVYKYMAVAVKDVGMDADQENKFLQQQSSLRNLSGVVRIFGVDFASSPQCIVMELAAGSLHDALHNHSLVIDLWLVSKLSILEQVCATMASISSKGILHRDLKPSNVLLFIQNNHVYAKISDFKHAQFAHEGCKKSVAYMAPELLYGQCTSASDVYSFGIMFNEMMTEKLPDKSLCSDRPEMCRSDPRDVLACEMNHCIERCWHQNPNIRLAFSELSTLLERLMRRASLPTSSYSPTEFSEMCLSTIRNWLTLDCHLVENDALQLAETLVYVKNVTSISTLKLAVDQNPELLTNELVLPDVHLSNIRAALGLPATTAVDPFPNILYELGTGKDLDTDYVAALFNGSRAAVERIETAAVAGNPLAKAYLTFLHKQDCKLISEKFVDSIDMSTDCIPWLLTAVESPNMYAQFVMAMCYHYEMLCAGPEAESKSLIYFKLAADQGHAGAQYALGLNIDDVDYFTLAADQGHAGALFELGEYYYVNSEDKQDKKNALQYYERAADHGHKEAQYKLGKIFEHGTVVSKDGSKALRYYQSAAEQSHASAEYRLGRSYEEGKLGLTHNMGETVKYYEKAAESGNANAQYRLGKIYESRKLQSKDDGQPVLQMAIDYYQRAAESGIAEAQYRLGKIYEDEKIVQKGDDENNLLTAVEYYQSAAASGNADAQYRLGKIYEDGKLGQKGEHDYDLQMAVKYYQRAAASGNADAQYRLGKIYEDGADGLDKDICEAAKYYELAAKQDHQYAIVRLKALSTYIKKTAKTDGSRSTSAIQADRNIDQHDDDKRVVSPIPGQHRTDNARQRQTMDECIIWLSNIIADETVEECRRNNAVVFKSALESGALKGHEGHYMYILRGEAFPRTYPTIDDFARDEDWPGGDPDGTMFHIPDTDFEKYMETADNSPLQASDENFEEDVLETSDKTRREKARKDCCHWLSSITTDETIEEPRRNNAAAFKKALESGALEGHEGHYIYILRGEAFPRTYPTIDDFARDEDWPGGDPDGTMFHIPDTEVFAAQRFQCNSVYKKVENANASTFSGPMMSTSFYFGSGSSIELHENQDSEALIDQLLLLPKKHSLHLFDTGSTYTDCPLIEDSPTFWGYARRAPFFGRLNKNVTYEDIRVDIAGGLSTLRLAHGVLDFSFMVSLDGHMPIKVKTLSLSKVLPLVLGRDIIFRYFKTTIDRGVEGSPDATITLHRLPPLPIPLPPTPSPPTPPPTPPPGKPLQHSGIPLMNIGKNNGTTER